jgi:hypothetical protein
MHQARPDLDRTFEWVCGAQRLGEVEAAAIWTTPAGST